MYFECGIKNSLPIFDNLFCPSIMDILRGEESDSGMIMFGVVPAEEFLGERPGVFDTTEPFREFRPVLRCLELRFRVGVVIADMRPGKAFGDAQACKHESDRFRCHVGPPIGMDSQLICLDHLFLAGLFYQLFCQRSISFIFHKHMIHVTLGDIFRSLSRSLPMIEMSQNHLLKHSHPIMHLSHG
jgi:hypothetical protein